ncbi:hypothetical protein [Nocardia xishanensis]
MPVTVNVPLRIIIDPQALVSRLDDLEEAIVAATGRALANATAVTRQARGTFSAHRPSEPDVTWKGAALPDVPLPTRVRCEWVVQRALAKVVQEAFADRSDVTEAASGDIEAFARRMIGDPSETVDVARLAPMAGLYLLPSYQDGEQVLVPIDTPLEISPPQVRDPWVAADLDDPRLERLRARAFARFSGAQVGVIYRGLTGAMMVVVWRRPEPIPWLPPTPLGDGESLELQGSVLKLEPFSTDRYQPHASYRLRYLGPARTQTERRETLRLGLRPGVRRRLGKDARRHEAKLEAIIEELSTGPAFACYLTLTSGGSGGLLVPCGHDVPDLDADLLVEPSNELGGHQVTDGDAGVEDEGGDGRRGVSVRPPEGGPPTVGPSYPRSAYTHSGETDCSSFNGEPPLDTIGEAAAGLAQLINEIATDLRMPLCPHAARFCLNAAAVVGLRAKAVADHVVATASFRKVPAVGTDPATVQSVPAASPAILLLRHLASVIPKLTELSAMIRRTYAEPAIFERIGGPWNESSPGWNLHFLIELTPALIDSVGRIFVRSCQVLLLQRLQASREAIDQRIANLPTYLPVLKKLILGFVLRVEDLDILHDQLAAATDVSLLSKAGREVFGTWQDAKRALADVLAGRDLLGETDTGQGEIIRRHGMAVGIRDRYGHIWTLDQLRAALELRRSTGVTLDPLVAQIVDDDHLLDRFRRDPHRIGFEICALLTEMQERNTAITNKVKSSDEQAFEYGRISARGTPTTLPGLPGLTYALSGIHLAVHEQIGEFFRGDPMYAAGIDRLLSARAGKAKLFDVIEIAGLAVLASICPPAATIAEAVLLRYQSSEALESEYLHRSLIDPEDIITRAEVESDLFFTELGHVLFFLPKAAGILRGGSAVAKAISRRGLTGGSQAVARRARRQLTVAMARSLRSATAEHVLQEIVEEQIEDHVLETLVLRPIAEAIQAKVGAAPSPAAGTAIAAPSTETDSGGLDAP